MNFDDHSKKPYQNLNHEQSVNEIKIFKSLENEESTVDLLQKNNKKNVGKFRPALAQILAVSSINLILLDLGMILAFPTIIIPELIKSEGSLRFSEEQASWFGSLAFIFQPLGSALSGLLFESLGRKSTMLYVNIPLMIGWLLIRFSTTVNHLFIAEIIMGISIGFTDAPHITYLGEITEPKWRGILTSYAELCVALGFSIVYFLGLIISWKSISTVCCFIPVISILLISWLPESPIWLLSKKKFDDALKSLRWLRGWVKPDIVREEFSEINHYINITQTEKKENDCNKATSVSSSKLNKIICRIGISDLFKKSLLQPSFLVATYFGFSHLAGVTNTRPFIINILKEFGTPMDPIWVTAISSVVGMVGFLGGMLLVPKTGKRWLSIMSMLGCAIFNGLISLYGFFFIHINISWIPALLFVSLNFIWSIGIGQVPWMLISEVFPFKGRGLASGIVASISYILAFFFIKTYYSLYNIFSIAGVFSIYGIGAAFGGLFLYIFLPETEGKTLDKIESDLQRHFEGIFKKSLKIYKRNNTEFHSS